MQMCGKFRISTLHVFRPIQQARQVLLYMQEPASHYVLCETTNYRSTISAVSLKKNVFHFPHLLNNKTCSILSSFNLMIIPASLG